VAGIPALAVWGLTSLFPQRPCHLDNYCNRRFTDLYPGRQPANRFPGRPKRGLPFNGLDPDLP